MLKEKMNPNFGLLTVFIIVVAAMRVLNSGEYTAWSNFTPIGALGLFGGAYFKKAWKAFAFPLLALLISDLIIQAYVYDGKYGILYGSWYWVYGGFCIIVLFGRRFLEKVSVKNVVLTSIASAVVYWVIVDFGVFLFGCTDVATGETMDHSFSSLLKCYTQSIPYMKNFLIGTLVYSGMMFGVYEWMKVRRSATQYKIPSNL